MIPKHLLETWMAELYEMFNSLSGMENTADWYGIKPYGDDTPEGWEDFLFAIECAKDRIKGAHTQLHEIIKEAK